MVIQNHAVYYPLRSILPTSQYTTHFSESFTDDMGISGVTRLLMLVGSEILIPLEITLSGTWMPALSPKALALKANLDSIISVQASLSRLYRIRRKLANHLKGLYSILGLVKVLRLKEIISGGIVVMKIGAGTKVTVGVISVLVVGFIGFQIATQQSDQEILPPVQAMQEASARTPRIPKTSRQIPDERNIQIQIDNATSSPDSSEESVTEEDVEDFLAFLDQLNNQNSPGMAQSTPNSIDDAELQKTQNEMANLEHQREVETVKQRMVDMVLEFGEVIPVSVRNDTH